MIVDLAVILGSAALATLVFSKLKQPVVLGYLIAGFFVGPHFSLTPTVVDNSGVHLWAEIGVIFLLFGLGLEFSFKKLAKVGKSAFIAALFELITMGAVGYLLGQAIGWTHMDSIYLAAILAMSSTTIIIRAFDETGFKTRAFASLVFGILIVEDLFAILLMVLLQALSQPGTLTGSNLTFLSARLIFFLLIWFLVGIYLVPTLLKKVRALLSNEILLIVSIGLCFFMVVLASKANFSSAIGAFIMGSILAETSEGERIQQLLSSVKDLFGAVFFVSIGMMIDPAVLIEHFDKVLVITVLTILGKLFGSGFGAVLSGRSLKHSVHAGMSLAQIGEFSFIIAGLGVSLNAIGEYVFPIVIAVSAVTTFTTPYMIKYSDHLYEAMERRLPDWFLHLTQQYEGAMANNEREGVLTLFWRTYGPLLLLNSVVIVAIGWLSGQYLLPLFLEAVGDHLWVRLSAGFLVLLACSPFLYGIILRSPRRLSDHEVPTLFRLSKLQLGVLLLRAALGLVLIEVIIHQFSTSPLVPLSVLLATPLVVFGFRGHIAKFYSAFEIRFLRNLNAKELAAVEQMAKQPQLAPWNAALAQVVVSPNADIAGQTLRESQFRTHSGATVGMIDRGRRRIFAPPSSERIWPGDQLFLIGTDEQLGAAHKLVTADHAPVDHTHDELFNLESILVEEGSRYSQKSIRQMGVSEEFGGLVVGIERGATRILNPESTQILQPGDLIWVFGQREGLKALKSACRPSQAAPS